MVDSKISNPFKTKDRQEKTPKQKEDKASVSKDPKELGKQRPCLTVKKDIDKKDESNKNDKSNIKEKSDAKNTNIKREMEMPGSEVDVINGGQEVKKNKIK